MVLLHDIEFDNNLDNLELIDGLLEYFVIVATLSFSKGSVLLLSPVPKKGH